MKMLGCMRRLESDPVRENVLLALRIAIFTLVVPATVVVYVPAGLASSAGSALVVAAGAPAVISGPCLVGWCFYEFAARGRGTPAPWDPPRHMVASGPFRWVRNPIYVGILLILLGEAAFFGSRALLAWAVLAAFSFHLIVVFMEEPGLRRRFGTEYDLYAANVPRWLPRLRRR